MSRKMFTDDTIVEELMCVKCKKHSWCTRMYTKYFNTESDHTAPSDDKLFKDRMDQTESFVIDRDIAKLQRSAWALWLILLAFMAALLRYTPMAEDARWLYTNYSATIFTYITVAISMRIMYWYAYRQGIKSTENEYGR